VLSAPRPLAALVLASAGLTPSALLAAENLRVRGAASVEATASYLDDHIEVKGAVRDDTGRPIGHSSVRLRLLERAGGAPLPLPSADACPPSPALRETRGRPGHPDEYSIDTDENGAFCARVPSEERGVFELTFSDTSDYYDPANRVLAVDRSRLGVELAFVAPPTALALETSRHQIALELRMRPTPEVRPELPVEVSIPGRPFREAVVVRAGETTQVNVPSSALGPPGPLELVARYFGTDRFQPAEARLRASATTRVSMTLAAPLEPGDAEEGIPVRVALGSAAGAVPSGSVEARIGDETVGIAKVTSGVAELTLRFEATRRSTPVVLYYLAAEPWWLASEPLQIQVQTLPPSNWGRWVWLFGLVVIAGWLLTGWWRPRPIPRPRPPARPLAQNAEPALRVVESADSNGAWAGHVLDAHDRVPIPGASVTLVQRSFEGERELQRVITGAEGEFSLSPLGDGGGVWIVVRARWHSTLERPIPPAGRLSVELVTRRRQLLGRLVNWAQRRGKPWGAPGEPTPGHVAQIARREQKGAISEWARAVESAAYGPDPVDEEVERAVLAREPDREPGEVAPPGERDH
jgi:hypothetical protein